MVEKVKSECIELIEQSTNYDVIDAVWRLLLQSLDRELTPESYISKEGLREWRKQKARNRQNRKN